MRTLIVYLILLVSFNSFSQNNATSTLTLNVKGNCGECKERIENAADIKGVKLCVWNEETQIATITYRADKVTPAEIEKAILAKGHDVGNTQAPQSSYNKLPSCCKFRDKKCEEKK